MTLHNPTEVSMTQICRSSQGQWFNTKWLALLPCLWLVIAAPAISAQEISPANIAQYAGGDRWDWTVYLKAAPEVLKTIECVQYTLHPTFPHPIRRVCEVGDPRFPFALSSNGWGYFEIGIHISFKDGRTKELKHMLSFAAPQKESISALALDNVARKIDDDYWEWTAFIRAPEDTLRQMKCVKYTLHPTFPNPIREVCNRGSSSQAFPLTMKGWGTFELKARVFFTDGTVQEITHELKF